MNAPKMNKLYNGFIGGLNTEAGPLNFPQGFTTDESNCDMNLDGVRERRKGFRSSSEWISSYTVNPEAIVTPYEWTSVGENGRRVFLCVQNGPIIYFFDASRSSGDVPSELPFFVDMRDYQTDYSVDLNQVRISMTSGKGYLFLSAFCYSPVFVEYNKDGNTISVEKIKIRIRDFDGVEDGLEPQQEPTTLSPQHHYNLRNQGWNVSKGGTSRSSTTEDIRYVNKNILEAVLQKTSLGELFRSTDSPIYRYFTTFKRYPSNSQQWWTGKLDADEDGLKAGDFSPKQLEKFYVGNTMAPRGHYIIDPFNIDRSGVSGVSGIPVSSTTQRPNSVEFYSGRIFYGVKGTVYYSQIASDKSKFGKCHQAADPTSEDISDLIASDGGKIDIPEMDFVVSLKRSGSGLLIFAMNGIWYISGTEGGFSADGFSITQVSSVGTKSPDSIVQTEGQILWISEVGIQSMSQNSGIFGPVDGSFATENLSDTRIKRFLDRKIGKDNLPYIKGSYDHITKRVVWSYPRPGQTNKNFHEGFLIFDTIIGAMFPWDISKKPDGVQRKPEVTCMFNTPSIRYSENSTFVTDGGELVLDGNLNVTATLESVSTKVETLQYLVITNENNFSFAVPDSYTFLDWGKYPYNSFMVTGYEIHQDSMRPKKPVYLFLHFDDDTGVNPHDTANSCKMQVWWDWSDRKSNEIEGFRNTRPRFYSSEEEVKDLDQLYRVITTKHLVRGQGTALQFKFSNNQPNSNFRLIGWSGTFTGEPQE